jgi:glucokinase
MLGVGIASAVTLLGLQRVVLGGGLTEAMGETLVALVRESVRTHAFPEVVKRVEVVGTKLMADAGLVGAAMLAAERLGRRPGAPRGKPAAPGARAAATRARRSPAKP